MQTSPAKLSSPRSAPDLDQLLRDLDESRPEGTALAPVTVRVAAVEPLELVLPAGVRLRIPRDFDEALLRRVLGVLASC